MAYQVCSYFLFLGTLTVVSCGAPLEQLNTPEKVNSRIAPSKVGTVGYEDYQSFESLDAIRLPTRIDMSLQSMSFPRFELGQRYFENPLEEIEIYDDATNEKIPFYIGESTRQGYFTVGFENNFSYGKNEIRVVLNNLNMTVKGSLVKSDFDYFFSSSSAVNHSVINEDGTQSTFQGWINSGASFLYSSMGQGGTSKVSLGDILLQ